MKDYIDVDPTGDWIRYCFSLRSDLIYFIGRFQGKSYRISWLLLHFDLFTSAIFSTVQNKLVAAVMENVVQTRTITDGTVVFQPFGLLHLCRGRENCPKQESLRLLSDEEMM